MKYANDNVVFRASIGHRGGYVVRCLAQFDLAGALARAGARYQDGRGNRQRIAINDSGDQTAVLTTVSFWKFEDAVGAALHLATTDWD